MKIRTASNIIFATIISLSTIGCTFLKQYRTSESVNPSDRDISYHEKTNKYDLFYVEIDDQGWLYKSEQLNKAVDFINKQPEKGCKAGPLIIAFAHGWYHNADSNDDNVSAMRKALEIVADNQKAAGGDGAERAIIGIYIGWRGRAAYKPIAHQLTFFSRKNVAHTIGASAGSKIVFSLEAAKRHVIKNQKDQSCKKDAPKLVVIGHSFGAALVYSAISSALNERMITLSKIGDSANYEAYKSQFTNQFFLFNPAFEASRIEHLTNIQQTIKQPTPLLSIITAKSDTATKIAFPAGRAIYNFFKPFTHRKTSTESQYKSDIQAVGHFSPWITHDGSVIEKNINFEPYANHLENKICAPRIDAQEKSLASFTAENDIVFCEYKLTHRENTIKNPLIINASVDANIAEGHGLKDNLGPMTKFIWDYIAVALKKEDDRKNKTD